MAEKDDDSLIGYDPLAWLHDAVQSECEAASLPVELTVAEEVPIDGEAINAVPELAAKSIEVAEQLEADVATTEVVDHLMPEQAVQIVLDSVQTIQNVAYLHERLLQALECHNKIDIDASAVTMVDTATLQLLLVLKQTAIKTHKEVAIDFPSERFIEAAELLGLAEMLDVDQAAAGFF